MSATTPGRKEDVRDDNPLKGDANKSGKNKNNKPGGKPPTGDTQKYEASSQGIGTPSHAFVDERLKGFEGASGQRGKQGLHVVHPRGQESTGNGPKGTQSGGREASDMHADQTNQTAMQGKTGSSGNLHDPGIKEVTVTAEESVVELQQVKHVFYDREDVVEVEMHVWKVDKDSLVVNFCPDTVHVTFQTSDAEFLKRYKGSTEQTKFSWTIRLKGQAQEDKCSFDVYSSYVYLKITKKVSGRWGDLENLKSTATKPEGSDDGGNKNAHQRPDSMITAGSADDSTNQPETSTVDDKQESVVELQQVNHRFSDWDNIIEVDMDVWKVDKDSLVVNFCPDTVHVTFQTSDAVFLKLYKGSTEQTKFSWTIRLKGQAQEDKCSVKVYTSYVYLKIAKKVSGRWGDLENLKRTGSKTNQEESPTQKRRVLPETPETEIGNSQPRNQDTKTKDAMPGDDQGESKGFDTDPRKQSERGSPDTSQKPKQDTPCKKDGDTTDKEPDNHQSTSEVRETNTSKGNKVQTKPTSQQQSGSNGSHGFPSTNPGTTGGLIDVPTDQPRTGTDTEPSQIATTTSGRRMPPPTPEDGDASGATQETLSRGHSNSQAKDPAEMHTDSQPNKHNLDGRKGEPASAAIGILAEGPKPKEDDDKKDHDVKKQIAEAMEDSESGTDNSREGSRDRSSPTPLRGSQRPDVASRIETSLSTQSHNTRDPLKETEENNADGQNRRLTSLPGNQGPDEPDAVRNKSPPLTTHSHSSQLTEKTNLHPNSSNCQGQDDIVDARKQEKAADFVSTENHENELHNCKMSKNKPLSSSKYMIIRQGCLFVIQDKQDKDKECVLENVESAHFEGDLLTVDGKFFRLSEEGGTLVIKERKKIIISSLSGSDNKTETTNEPSGKNEKERKIVNIKIPLNSGGTQGVDENTSMEHSVIVHVNGDEEIVCLNMEKLMKLNYLLKYPDFLEQICKTFQSSYILKIERSETEIIFPCSKDKTYASNLLEKILSKANLVYTEFPFHGLFEDTVEEQLKLSQVDTKVHWIVDSNQSKVLIVCNGSVEAKAARYVSKSIQAAKTKNVSLEMALCVRQMFEKELKDAFGKKFPNIKYKWSPVGEYRCSMTLDGRDRNEAVEWIQFECVDSVGRVTFEHIMSGCSVDAIHKLTETLHVYQGKYTIYWVIDEKEKSVLFCSSAGAHVVGTIVKRLKNSIVQKTFDLPEKLNDEKVQTLLESILSELQRKFEYIVGKPLVTEQSVACSSLQFSYLTKDQESLEPGLKYLLGKYRAICFPKDEIIRCFDHNPAKCSYFTIQANRGKIEKIFHTVLKHNCSIKGKCKIHIVGEKTAVDDCASYIDKLTKQHIVCHMEGPDSTKVIGKIENACHENYVAYEVEHVGNKYPPSPKSPLMVDHKCWLFPNRSQLTVTKLSLDDCPAELKVTMKEQESTSPPNQTFCQIGEGSAVLNIPKWESGKEKDNLSQAFKSILDAAEKEETYNIAVAVIPTSWQSHKHMKIIFNTFENYVKKRSTMDPSINMTFCCSIEGTFEDCIGMFNKAAEKLKCTSQSITEKMEVVINSGSFAHVAAEVLVNSANVNLKMKEGRISSLILMREGEDLQSTISYEHPRALKTEEVYATKGKSCKWIFHIALPPKSDPSYMEVLKTLVFNSLCEAENKRCASIAFPALGIGKTLQYELKEVAQSMLSVAEKFQRERRPLYLKKMQIVIFQEDQCVEFKKVQQSIQEKKKPKDISRTLFFGRARVHGEYGTLDNVDSQVLVYLWEKDEIKGEAAGGHPLVSRLDSKDKKLWKTFKDKLSKKDPRNWDILETKSGGIRCETVLHVLCTADTKDIQRAVTQVLKYISDKAIQSATFFFNNMHALLVIEKFQVADTILREIMNSIHMFKSDCSLTILTEGMHNKSHLFGYIQNIEPVDLAGKNCVVLDVFGEDSCVNQLISTVKQLQGISKVEVRKDNNQEDKAQTIGNEIEEVTEMFGNLSTGAKVPAQMAQTTANASNQWNPSVDLDDEVTSRFLVANVPEQWSKEELKAPMRDAFPNIEFGLHYLKGKNKIVLSFKTPELARDVHEKRRKLLNITLENHPKEVLLDMKRKVNLQTLTDDQNKQLTQMVLDEFPLLTVFQNEDGVMVVNCKTKFARDLLLELESSCKIAPKECEVKNISQNIWDMFCILKSNEIKNINLSKGTITYESGIVKMKVPEHIFNKFKEELISPLESLNDSEKYETNDHFPIPTDRVDTVEEFCREFEKNNDCICVYSSERQSIIVNAESYDSFRVIRSRITNWIADGKANVKVTGHGGRRRRHAAPLEADLSSKSSTSDLRKSMRKIPPPCVSTKQGIMVYVYKGDICSLDVDCIVNAANEQLGHWGGVARVIADRAGRALTVEGDEYISTNGYIPVGKAIKTTAGNLDYKCVIHTVGPKWDDFKNKGRRGQEECRQKLLEAVLNSLILANKEKMHSIALPAISSAIFGVPLDICASEYKKAFQCYIDSNDCNFLKEVHFVDIRDKVVTIIEKEFQGDFESSDEYVHLSTGDQNVGNECRTGTEKYTPEKGNNSGEIANARIDFEETEGHNFKMVQEPQHCLNIISQDIFEVNADAVVVIIDQRNKRGTLAKLVNKKMDNYQHHNYDQDVKMKLATNKQNGDVFETMGFGSGFSSVLHVILSYGIKDASLEYRKNVLSTAYKNIFKKSQSMQNIKMISMVVLGTGGKDDTVCASVLWESFVNFCESSKSTHDQKKFNIVCRSQNDFELVRSVLLSQPQFAVTTQINKNSKTNPFEDCNSERSGEACAAENDIDMCVICMEVPSDPLQLPCGHTFCKKCIDECFKYKKQCPTCGKVCGTITGNQPYGKMVVTTDKNSCSGFGGYGRILMRYEFRDGNQEVNHPTPGALYKGIRRTGYLPRTNEGKLICRMMKVAFQRKLVFTIGSSRTTGKDGVITWNDIHHKTDPNPHSQFGYPDPTYLERVKEELAAKGVTETDIDQNQPLEESIEI